MVLNMVTTIDRYIGTHPFSMVYDTQGVLSFIAIGSDTEHIPTRAFCNRGVQVVDEPTRVFCDRDVQVEDKPKQPDVWKSKYKKSIPKWQRVKSCSKRR